MMFEAYYLVIVAVVFAAGGFVAGAMPAGPQISMFEDMSKE